MARLFVGLVLLFAAAIALAEGEAEPAPKSPVPDAAQVQASLKLLNETYQADLVAAVTAEKKMALANKLGAAGREDKDPVAQYVLLSKARDLAVESGELGVALTQIAALDRSFVIDGLKMQAAAATALGKVPQTPVQRLDVAWELPAVVDAALQAERYDLAGPLADMATNAARQSGDDVTLSLATARLQKVKELQSLYASLAASLKTLEDKPNDPDASLKVGRFRCFFKGDWSGGLPLLAAGSDAALQALAKRETEGVGAEEGQRALAEDWWVASLKEPPTAKLQIQAHARQWYRKAWPGLTAAVQLKVQSRLKEVLLPGRYRALDLLPLVDVQAGAVSGTWSQRDGALVSGDNDCAIEFPYQPPEEYDYRIIFTPLAGPPAVGPVCLGGGRQFLWILGWEQNQKCFFDNIMMRGPENPTTKTAAHWYDVGQRCMALIKVRRNGVQGFLNGKLVCEWRTDFRDMALWCNWALHRPNVLGLRENAAPVAFHQVQVVEVSGDGKTLDPEDKPPAKVVAVWKKRGGPNAPVLTLYANSHIDAPDSKDIWYIQGRNIILRFGPDNFYNGLLSNDRRSFVGKDQGGNPVLADLVSGGI